MFKYLGAYHGTFLFCEEGRYYMQVDDGAHQAAWVNVRVNKDVVDEQMRLGRTDGDYAFQVNSANVLPGVTPIWETHPREYLEWHRDNDPPPYRERAAEALAGLDQTDAE